MKRSPALQPLSHDHYEGLHLVARLRKALRAGEDMTDWPGIIAAFWCDHLVPHFAEEEALVLPVLREGAPPLAERMSREHEALRRLTEAVGEAGAAPGEVLTSFADALAAHIRFEEREAFPVAEGLLGIGTSAPPDADGPDADD
ncbi:MAG: hemerythrin domain-containing protein [Rhodothermales bacterium]